MRYKAVIFDLDGTLLDTLDDLTAALNFALVKNGYKERTKSEVRSFVGNGLKCLTERGIGQEASQEKVNLVYQELLNRYGEHSSDMTKPYDGIVSLLQWLKEHGYLLAVVSNKADSAVLKLCHEYFEGYFFCAVGEKKDVRRKPYPDSVFEAAKKMSVAVKDALYIGDSEVDLETAHNAGMDIISVCWGFRDRDFLISKGAERLVSKPDEIREFL